jgi:hypothetical protein
MRGNILRNLWPKIVNHSNPQSIALLHFIQILCNSSRLTLVAWNYALGDPWFRTVTFLFTRREDVIKEATVSSNPDWGEVGEYIRRLT